MADVRIRYYRPEGLPRQFCLGLSLPPKWSEAGSRIRDKADEQNFKLTKYELEPLEDDRITVNVECCGVCGSVSFFPVLSGRIGYKAATPFVIPSCPSHHTLNTDVARKEE